MTFRIFIGYDPRDDLAYRAAVRSLFDHASIPVEVIGLRDPMLRVSGAYWRPYMVEENGQMIDAGDGRPFSTQFAFTRFLTPHLARLRGVADDEWVLFTDADVLWRADIAELVADLSSLSIDTKVAVVKHQWQPVDSVKMGGLSQVGYARKNWSSVMAFRASVADVLTPHLVNTASGQALHGFTWIADENLGDLDPRWNWLEPVTDWAIPRSLVHYTRGTPDLMPGPGWVDEDEWWSAVRRFGGDLEALPCSRES